MRANLAIPMFLAVAFTMSAQAPSDPEDVLAKARDKMLERTERLPNYMCVQTVDRRYLKPEKPEFPVLSCDDLSARSTKKNYRLKLEGTDRLRLDVKVSGGTEIGSWAGASHFEDGNVMKLMKGPYGTGGFGTFLTDIFSGPSSVRFFFEGEDFVDSLKLLKYRFEVARDASHYMVHAGSEWIYTGYDGDVWIDPTSFELRRLRVRTGELPEETGACESTTTVEYATMRVGAGDFLLPQRSNLHFLMRDMGESDVATTYSACHQYHAESSLVAEPSTIAGPATARFPISIPAGLVVTLKLDQPIDTDTAAAGDVVVATVSDAGVPDPKSKKIVQSRETVIQKGSVVRGRIVLMQHRLDVPRSFASAMQLETVEINGIPSPLYAIRPINYEPWTVTKVTLEHRERTRPMFLAPRGQSRLVSDFSHFTNAQRYVMPRGFETQWTTVSPQPGD
jgi:hypothetical protein